MKKFLILLTIPLLLSAIVNTLVFADDPVNLLQNASVETVNGTVPAGWVANNWGGNTTTHEYKAEGHTGSRSLYAAVSNHVDGDAKWMHTPVSVKANTSYTYSNWYKSNTSTEIDIQYINTAGVVSYEYIGWLPASSDWQQISMKFTTPADAKELTVMHIIAMDGWLQADDFSLTETVVVNPSDEHGLVPNGEFETANGSIPAAWNTNSWGVNIAQFTYDTAGRTGRSALVSISSYTSGDAKWYADPVDITGGKSYIYQDYHKGDVPSRAVAAFIDGSGNYSYMELAAPTGGKEWHQYRTTFTAPTNAVKVTVFHLIDRVGNLWIDDVTLEPALQTPPIPTSPTIPNASMEIDQNGRPAGWQTGSWGTNTPTFSYVNEGHNSTKSTRVSLSQYTSGDAKWLFDPITTLNPGEQYRFSAWYKTNVTPHPVAMFIMADGSARYFGMPIARPAADSATVWQQYSDVFSVPEGAVAGSVFMYINQVGWLQTDDYSLTQYSPEGFSRPLLTLTFDDGHEDNATNALPIMNQYGFKSTQCYATQFLEGMSQQIINDALAFQKSGHEICSHTVTHPFLTTKTGSSLTYELSHSKQYLEQLTGAPVRNFASPYGDYDTTVVNEIKKYYQSHRSVDEGYNSKDNFDAYSLRVQNVLDTTSATQVADWIAEAQANNTWLILVYHRVADDPGPYDSYINDFEAQMAAVKASGISVKTYQDAFVEATSQL